MDEAALTKEGEVLRHLFDEAAIRTRLDQLASQIAPVYVGRPLTVVAILQGSMVFAADLLRRLPLPLHVETLTVASYHGGTRSSGRVEFRQNCLPNVRGRHVLLIDDILDSGRTLQTVRGKLESESAPESLKTCVLLDKRAGRTLTVEADFVGFDIPDEFVVGYGLDYELRFRNLPYIATLHFQ